MADSSGHAILMAVNSNVFKLFRFLFCEMIIDFAMFAIKLKIFVYCIVPVGLLSHALSEFKLALINAT